MHRTTIMLPERLRSEVVRESSRLGISLGAYVREALEMSLASQKVNTTVDPLFSDSAVYSGEGPSDAALNHDEYLYGDEG